MNHHDAQDSVAAASGQKTTSGSKPVEWLEWDWEIEHADRQRERKADAALYGALPFEVDRKLLKDVVREKSCVDVARIKFLSSGTFHKAYLVTLADGQELVARVARRYMPRLKTESEVATIQYLRENTNIPVPTIYHYDSNPYNRLGGEYILMSKAKGIPLSQVYHTLSYSDLVKLLTSIAELVIPLFAHRFSKLGSIYFGPDPKLAISNSSVAATPKALQMHYSAFPFSPRLPDAPDPLDQAPLAGLPVSGREFHVGPIISWPFFGSNRGELKHPEEINLGPWTSTQAYLASCMSREVNGVIQENEGKSAPHKLHLDPDEIYSSRHHKLKAVPGDESDDSDEYDDLEESRAEWDGPGDAMYRDYRRMQRSTFLLAHLKERENSVRKEMSRWLHLMERLTKALDKEGQAHGLEAEDGFFAFDCHDLNLENMFVDAKDPSRITCIIDWEATTTRPLWAAAHLPAFLQSSPFTAKLFRDTVRKMATAPPTTGLTKPSRMTKTIDPAALAREWLHYEAVGFRLRMVHRCVEWDGWEEGLVESIIGPEEFEDDWFRDCSSIEAMSPTVSSSGPTTQRGLPDVKRGSVNAHKVSSKLPFAKELARERVLDTTGDICGGRGGELGRRLEAWLTITGAHVNHGFPVTPIEGPSRWAHEDTEHEIQVN